jgi:hypothetical protein
MDAAFDIKRVRRVVNQDAVPSDVERVMASIPEASPCFR